jgi:hypothetical protein
MFLFWEQWHHRQPVDHLMSDFLDCSEKLIRLKKDGVVQAEEAFKDVFDALAELQGVHAKHTSISIISKSFLVLLKWPK